MAAWTFMIELLPQQWLDAGGALGSLYRKGGYSTSAAWESWDAGDPESIEHRIGSVLQLVESWSGPPWRRLSWGDPAAEDTENGIQLIATHDRVAKLGVRWDMRRPDLPMFGHIVSAAGDLRLALLDVERQRIVPPDVNALLWAAATCRAAWFWKDRTSFLRSLGDTSEEAT